MPMTSSPTATAGDPLAHGGDPAGELHARDLGRGRGEAGERRARVEAAALEQVGPVQRGGDHVDQHLLGAGHRVGHLGDAEDVGLPVGLQHDSAHLSSRWSSASEARTAVAGPAVVGLARGRAGHAVGEHPRPGDLVAGEVARGRARPARRSDGRRHAGAHGDDRAHPLAEALVGHADDEGVEDRRMALEHALDLLGEDLLAAGVDAGRAPAQHPDRAVGLDHRRRRPSTAHRTPSTTGKVGRGALGVAPVAERARGPAGRACRRSCRRRAPGRHRPSSSHTVVASSLTSRGGPPSGAGTEAALAPGLRRRRSCRAPDARAAARAARPSPPGTGSRRRRR